MRTPLDVVEQHEDRRDEVRLLFRRVRVALALGMLLSIAALLSACGTPSADQKGQAPATREETTPTVGDTVLIANGRVSLTSVTTTPPPAFVTMTNPPSLWVHLQFENWTDSSVEIVGARGAPRPEIRAADGSTVDVTAFQSGYRGGTGGWSPGQSAVHLNPGGVLYADFGLRPTRGQYLPGRLPLRVSWQPSEDGTATFEVR